MVWYKDYIMDVLSELEGTSALTTSRKAEVVVSKEWKLGFRKFLWPKHKDLETKNEQLINIIFAQVNLLLFFFFSSK